MSSVFFRGPKAAPRWYARFLERGVWRSRRVRVESRREALAIARRLEGEAERIRYGLQPAQPAVSMRELLERFGQSLVNRSYKDDLSRLRHHVTPQWATFTADAVTLPRIMEWLDRMKAEAKIAPATQRHALGLLSRAFSWAISRGLAERNPCRDVPAGSRPQAAPPAEGADSWISDEGTLRRLMQALRSPHSLAFYLCATSGLRQGEAYGLRMADLDDLAEGSIRVGHSYAGPLKEDKRGSGKTKLVPAAGDAPEMLAAWLAARRAAGAGPDDLLFPGEDGRPFPRYVVAYAWRRAREAVGVILSWHASTRRSAASRWASRGVPIDQIATALGHSTPAITARSYNKFRRKTFDPRMTSAFTQPEGAKVIPLSTQPQERLDGQEIDRPEEPEGEEDAA